MRRRAISTSSLLTIIFGCLLGAPAIAAPIIVQYGFPLGSFLPTTTALNATSAAISTVGSSALPAPGIGFPNTLYLEQGIVSTTPAAAVANNQFFSFTISANAGYQLDLSDLTFDAARGGSSSPRGWVLRSSIDGFAANIATDVVPTDQPTVTPFSVNLSAAQYQGLLSPVTFRIYGYAPTAPGVGTYYDNLTLNGLVTQTIPIPSALLMLLGGLGALVPVAKRARH